MTVLQVKARQTTAEELVSEGADAFVKGFRNGSISVVDFVAGLSAAGRVFIANAGTVTTPITFGAGTIDEAEFDLHVAVPANKVIIPLEIQLHMEAFGTTAIFEYLAAWGTGSTVGAGTSITPRNTNLQSSDASACTITAAATTTSGVALANDREFWRGGVQKIITVGTVTEEGSKEESKYMWSWKDSGVLHLVGPSAQLGIFAAAQAGTGFIIFTYAETPSTWWV